jgi:hypothetical protein
MTEVPLRRVALLLALLISSGCSRTVYHAVIAPHVSMNDARSCFRGCQMRRAAGTKQYLACLNTCTDVSVVNESGCEAVPFDARQYGCTTEHDRTFSPAPGIAAIFLGVLSLYFLLALSAPERSSQ